MPLSWTSSPPDAPSGAGAGLRDTPVPRPDGEAALAALRALYRCDSYLVDGECGYDVGVVEQVRVEPATGWPLALVVVRGWRRRPVEVPVDSVREICPAERRLVVACPAGHRATCRRGRSP